MGISGLLPLLKQIQEPTTLMKYKGKTLAIDTYAWLHRSIFTCAMELAQDKPTNKYVNYVLKRIEMLHHFGITPYLVFDGDYLPCKTNTEIDRDSRRKEYRKQGLIALERGDSKTAYSCFQKSCDITPLMAKLLIDVLRRKNIKYVVAPYEADSQMVYLEKIGVVDGIISEDSDLLIFGCKRLITKLNDRGECVEINKENFKNCKQVPVQYLTQDQLRIVAALSGCDYTKGIQGIGIVKAFGLVKKHGTMEKVLNALKLEGKYKIPDSFSEEFERADIAFQYQLVFDPVTHLPTNLSQIPDSIDLELRTYSGERFDDHIHFKVATGDFHPVDKVPLISREDALRNKNSEATRTSSLYQNGIVNTPGYTPARVAARAYSTPSSGSVSKTRSIESFFSKTSQPPPDSYITPVSSKRTRNLVAENPAISTPKTSPISKRKRVLHTPPKSTGQVSKFFKKMESVIDTSLEKITSPISTNTESQDLVDIDERSAEDSMISESYHEEDSILPVSKDVLTHGGLNSSDFDIEEVSDNETEELQGVLTQTSSSAHSSKDSLLRSISEKISSRSTPSVVETTIEEISGQDLLSVGNLRSRFSFTQEVSANKDKLQSVALKRNQSTKSSNNPEKSSIKSNFDITKSFVEKAGALNLDSFKFKSK